MTAKTIADTIKGLEKETVSWSRCFIYGVGFLVAGAILSPWAIKYARSKRRLDRQIAEQVQADQAAETDKASRE